MVRLNYAYDRRYLLTLTGRRDGYSGFGTSNKWGIFPSVALGWNVANERFFPFKDVFNDFKLRASIGLNGNQAVGAYESISRLSDYNMVDGKISVPGYRPTVLGQDNLGWEASRTANLGVDFAVLKSRISGDLNFFQTNTSDLLLNRTISPVHGVNEITQNIGKTENRGVELSLSSININAAAFTWNTSANLSFIKNKITSLYGYRDEEGREVDDVANAWFIGKPILVNYDFVWDGTWQLDEFSEAEKWGSQPGFVKLRDVNGDNKLDAADRQIIGQQDPRLLWGLTNSFSYGNFNLSIFVHGVHGVTRDNAIMSDNVTAEVRNNTIKKNWWTPENPTNEWIMNHLDAGRMSGVTAGYYQDASFIRLKDVSLSYDFPTKWTEALKINRLRTYATARNLMTITKWNGVDPELSGSRIVPMQKEFVFGITFDF